MHNSKSRYHFRIFFFFNSSFEINFSMKFYTLNVAFVLQIIQMPVHHANLLETAISEAPWYQSKYFKNEMVLFNIPVHEYVYFPINRAPIARIYRANYVQLNNIVINILILLFDYSSISKFDCKKLFVNEGIYKEEQ